MKLVFQKTVWGQFSVGITYVGSTLQEWHTFGGVPGERGWGVSFAGWIFLGGSFPVPVVYNLQSPKSNRF